MCLVHHAPPSANDHVLHVFQYQMVGCVRSFLSWLSPQVLRCGFHHLWSDVYLVHFEFHSVEALFCDLFFHGSRLITKVTEVKHLDGAGAAWEFLVFYFSDVDILVFESYNVTWIFYNKILKQIQHFPAIIYSIFYKPFRGMDELVQS